MLAKRIIPCLDVKDGVVVKGVKFRNHEVMGDILSLAKRYCEEGADELVFYDITASSDGRSVSKEWVRRVAEQIDIPFAVAGGIRSVAEAAEVLAKGADKISINSPALSNPALITELVASEDTTPAASAVSASVYVMSHWSVHVVCAFTVMAASATDTKVKSFFIMLNCLRCY